MFNFRRLKWDFVDESHLLGTESVRRSALFGLKDPPWLDIRCNIENGTHLQNS